jgi:calcineurin-like phosphoesterase
MLRILFVGDIVGRPGREMLMERLPRLRSELKLDAVIANGENAAAGAGINGGIARGLLQSGVGNPRSTISPRSAGRLICPAHAPGRIT